MSLTLDEIRNIKFRMAKRSGYEVLDVDEFVDQIEASYEQVLQENANLKRQIESLQSTGGAAAVSAQPREQQPVPPAMAVAESPSGERIVVTTSAEASTAVVRLVQMSTEQAEALVAEAEAEAQRIRTEAGQNADQVNSDARADAERVRSEAQADADRLTKDTAEKRREMFSELEKQRDQLAASVTELRQFEARYRENLTDELRGHIDTLSSRRAEPDGAPRILDELGDRPAATGEAGASTEATAAAPPVVQQSTGADGSSQAEEASGGPAASATPRLDALLNEDR